MTSTALDEGRRPTFLVRGIILATWIAAMLASGLLSPSAVAGGLSFVVLACAAFALTGFTPAEARAALRHAVGSADPGGCPGSSALFWESAARTAWVSGALGSILFFAIALWDSERETHVVAIEMALSFVPALYGLALAALFLMPALRARRTDPPAPGRGSSGAVAPPGSGPARGVPWDRWLGSLLFLILLAWTVGRSSLGIAHSRFTPWGILMHGPALLVVVGAALVLRLVAGNDLGRRIGAAIHAIAGGFGSLVGMTLALLGFVDGDLSRLTSGMSFCLTACFLALLGILVLAAPAEDRRASMGEAGYPSVPSRVACLVFPLAALAFTALTLFLAITPMIKKM